MRKIIPLVSTMCLLVLISPRFRNGGPVSTTAHLQAGSIKAFAIANKTRLATCQPYQPFRRPGCRALGSRFASLGTAPVDDTQSGAQALRTHLAAEVNRWRPLIKKAGVYAD